MIDQINDPNIRLLNIPQSSATHYKFVAKENGKCAIRKAVGGFSAVAYFFGKKLNQNLNVPIGLINASWGGSPAEVWFPEEIVETNDVLRASSGKIEQ